MDEYKAKVQAAQDYHAQLTKWQQNEQARLEQEINRYKKLTGEEDSLDNPNGSTKYLTAEEVQKKEQEILFLNAAMARISTQHLKEFDEVLDLQKVFDVAAKEGTNINTAYELLVRPKREEVQKAEFQKQLDEARKQGADEALKNYKLPTSDVPFQLNGPAHVLDAPRGEGQQYGAMAAVKAFEEAYRSGKLSSLSS
jgi:2-phospho-L-lactate guanylyltransferase (CobY/MobA/RfbA family)